VPPPRTGQVRANSNGFSARIRVAPGAGGRVSFELAARSETAAEERAALLASMADALRGAAAPDEIELLLAEAGKARNEKALAEVKAAADAIAKGETTKAASAKAPTFEEFAKSWTSGDLHKKHPDHVRAKDSTRDLEVLRLYINPVIGPLRIADVLLEDVERVMAKLPSDLAPRSRKLIAQCARKVLSLAVYPGRYLAGNPIPREWMPKVPKSANKAKAFLYPAEDAKLLACTEIPIERRLAYGILDREGMRASELEDLKWRDLDLEHGRVRLDENKTDDPRAWALSPDVVRTLAWWKKTTKGEPGHPVVRAKLRHGARFLRGHEDGATVGDLHRAGVRRAELFERSASRQPLRLHDLRATFVTVSLANGRTEQWVTDRTGHKSSAMVALYARQARTWSRAGARAPRSARRASSRGEGVGRRDGREQGLPRSSAEGSGRDWTGSVGRCISTIR
jgi:integrase